MYISYARLWKLLIDKGINKTQLMEMTGISSRTLSKLSKNQTVTTDTLLSICGALNCDFTDIMEAKAGDEKKSFFAAFKSDKQLVSKCQHTSTFLLSYNGKDYTIIKTRKIANKHTFIACTEGGIIWEQAYPLGTHPVRERWVIAKKGFQIKDSCAILVISGEPNYIKNLGEYGYLSQMQARSSFDDVIILTESEFKKFVVKE
ncbi:MAG: helix-turn-helix transcriptional regulator [Clostridia bacterium]|nr:helix-turn-helix transcriptional regulator [Clostridia bacterium]